MSVAAIAYRGKTFSHSESRNELYTAIRSLDFARLERDLTHLPSLKKNSLLNSPINAEGIAYPNFLDYAVRRLIRGKTTNPQKLHIVALLLQAGSHILPDARKETILHKALSHPLILCIIKNAIQDFSTEEKCTMLDHKNADGLTALQCTAQKILHIGGSHYLESARLLLEMEGSPLVT